jgi:hypothetical protein
MAAARGIPELLPHRFQSSLAAIPAVRVGLPSDARQIQAATQAHIQER